MTDNLSHFSCHIQITGFFEVYKIFCDIVIDIYQKFRILRNTMAISFWMSRNTIAISFREHKVDEA